MGFILGGILVAELTFLFVHLQIEGKKVKEKDQRIYDQIDAHNEKMRKMLDEEQLSKAQKTEKNTIKQNNTVKTEKVEDVEMGNN